VSIDSIRPWRQIQRRKSREINVGKVKIGGDNPISVQTMTNTDTSDSLQTLRQINDCAEAGAEIVRVSCPDEASTSSLKEICKFSEVPIVADIHFHYKRAIEAAKAGASCLRINPGNIGKNERVKEVIKAAKDYNCSIRIGVNAGSLEKDLLEKYREPCPEALLESGMRNIALLEDNDFFEFKISVKASDVFLGVASYTGLSEVTDAPIHIGITEAGSKFSGTVKSAIGLGNLLWAGIGDTIRVSLSADPVEEVKAGYEILKSLNLRHRGVQIISCPSCARQGFDVISTVGLLEEKLSHVKTPISLSIIGCVVNGPGEALMTDIGFTGGGAGHGMIYHLGKVDHKISNDKLVDHIVDLVEKRVEDINKKTS
jgi:(E)-4-hydroxy-3-methylbut-2-enyl-diphosphate synthase